MPTVFQCARSRHVFYQINNNNVQRLLRCLAA